LKISLDSNVFADQDFIDWLQERKDQLDIYLSVICALETFHWYNLRGISQELFEKDLEALGATIHDFNFSKIYQISANAKKAILPFKHHARDFIIVTQAIMRQSKLITFNLKHFGWLGKDNVLAPEDLVIALECSG